MGILVPFVSVVATVLALVLGALYLFFKYKFTYWSRRKIPFTPPSIPLGNLSTKVTITENLESLYRTHRMEKFFGFYMMSQPHIMINDPDLIKRILVQDFAYFPDHGNYVNVKEDPLQYHLFSTKGAEWKNLRSKLSTTFSSGKMKNMFPILEDVAQNLNKVLKPIAEKQGDVEIKDIIGRYAMDSIGTCAYGIEVNSLENPDTEFRVMAKRIFLPTWDNILRNTLGLLAPEIAKLVKLVQTDKLLSKFFLGLVRNTMDYREKNNVKRNDFMQMIMELMEKGVKNVNDKSTDEGDPFSFDMAAANAFVFLLGGYETTTGALQFTIYELAKNQDMQEKLRKEIQSEMQKSDGKLTYEGVFNMKYLGMILEESQRVYTLAAVLMRECVKDYKIPGSDFTIEKGTKVGVCVAGLHHDERYFPKPDVFDPERFTDEAKGKRNNYVYLPFGDGPRNCIGMRFAQMQMRIAICAMFSKYRFEVSEKTPDKLVMDPKYLVQTPIGGIHLKVSEL